MSDASDRPVPAVPAQVATQPTCQCGHPRSVHVEEVGPCHNPAACFCAEFRYNVPADEFQEKAAAATGIGATPATQEDDLLALKNSLWPEYIAAPGDYEFEWFLLSKLAGAREERDRLVEIIKEQDKTVIYEFRRYKAEREARKQAEDALRFVKAWFAKLEDNTDPLDHALKTIRQRVHAPIHAVIDAALAGEPHE